VAVEDCGDGGDSPARYAWARGDGDALRAVQTQVVLANFGGAPVRGGVTLRALETDRGLSELDPPVELEELRQTLELELGAATLPLLVSYVNGGGGGARFALRVDAGDEDCAPENDGAAFVGTHVDCFQLQRRRARSPSGWARGAPPRNGPVARGARAWHKCSARPMQQGTREADWTRIWHRLRRGARPPSEKNGTMTKLGFHCPTRVALLLGALAITSACKEDDDAGDAAAGGTGAASSGGLASGGVSGGDAGTGPDSGGAPVAGGSGGGGAATGGGSGSGGLPGSGGLMPAGGSAGGGGLPGIGGVTLAGGSSGSGGLPGIGGVTSSGGAPAGGTAGAVGAGAPGSGGQATAGTAGSPVSIGGSAGAPSGGAGGSVAGAGTCGVANGGTAGAGECLAADDGMVGAGGGTCEVARCGDESSATYRTCNWLWQNARFSVFWETLACIRDTPDFCDDQAATIAACEASVFPRACVAPGAVVGDVEVDCADVVAGCPQLSEQECSTLMSILQEEERAEAYACFFLSPHPLEACAQDFRACVGLPE